MDEEIIDHTSVSALNKRICKHIAKAPRANATNKAKSLQSQRHVRRRGGIVAHGKQKTEKDLVRVQTLDPISCGVRQRNLSNTSKAWPIGWMLTRNWQPKIDWG